MNKVFFFSLTLWICIFFSFFFHFSFVLKRREERKWVEKRFCSLFFSSLNFLIQNDRILLFLLVFLSFCFFSSVFQTFSFFFSFPFPALEGKWEWEGVGIFPLLFLNSFLFWEKNERINWKKSKGIRLLFLLKFLYFFFLLILLFFSFWERKWEIGRIKKFAPIALKRFCKNIVFF